MNIPVSLATTKSCPVQLPAHSRVADNLHTTHHKHERKCSTQANTVKQARLRTISARWRPLLAADQRQGP